MARGACRLFFLITVVSSAEHISDVACQTDVPEGAAALLQRSGRRGNMQEQQEEADEKSQKASGDLADEGNDGVRFLKIDAEIDDEDESVTVGDAKEDDGGEASLQDVEFQQSETAIDDEGEGVTADDTKEDDGAETSMEVMEPRRENRLMTDDEESDGTQLQESGAAAEDESMIAKDVEEDDGPEALPEEGASTEENDKDAADMREERESTEVTGCPSWPADRFTCVSSHQFSRNLRDKLQGNRDYMCICQYVFEAIHWLDIMPHSYRSNRWNRCLSRGFSSWKRRCIRKGMHP